MTRKPKKADRTALAVSGNVTVWISGLTSTTLLAGHSYPIVPTPDGWDKADHKGQLERWASVPSGAVPQVVADVAVKKGAAEIVPAG